MIHNVLVIVFILVTASFYDGIARDLAEEAHILEVSGEQDDDEVDKGFTFQAITGCRPEDYSYECVDKRKWYNVVEKIDIFFDHYYYKDKKSLEQYLASFVGEKVQYRQFTTWEKGITHRYARHLIAGYLVRFLRILETDVVKSIYSAEKKESVLKYAARFVYYEKMKRCIDEQSVISDVFQMLVCPLHGDDTLDLAFIKKSFFQQLLFYSHELFYVFFAGTIEKLFLYKCDLTAVPDFNIPTLKELWIFNNKLERVPNFTLPHLEMLDLTLNKLQEVPDFSQLQKLTTLKLSHNKLTKVTGFALPSLTSLSLAYNNLMSVKLWLEKLKVLDVSGNNGLEGGKLDIYCPALKDFIFDGRVVE